MYISLPGNLMFLNLFMKRGIAVLNMFMTVEWLFRYNMFYFNSSSLECENIVNKPESCLTFTAQSSEKIYFVIGDITDYYNHQTAARSWNEAAQLCQKIKGYLPYFTSRNELNELIFLLRHSSNIPIMEGIFIGLKDVMNWVSFTKCYFTKNF